MSPDDPDEPDPDEPVHVELTDVLDLHPFHPREIAGLVRDYLDHAVAQGWRHVRLIHGKGIGVRRDTVHRVLASHPAVERFGLAGEGAGGWGATVVTLRIR